MDKTDAISLHAKIQRAFDLDASHRLYRAMSASEQRRNFWRHLAERIRFHFLPFFFGHPPKWRMRMRRLASRNRVVPDFAVIGPIKSGTSDMAVMLMCHPNIVRPFVKEVRPFFPRRAVAAYYPSVRQMRRTEKARGAAVTGYFSPWLGLPGIPEYLRAELGIKKVIIPLRDPVKRAYSHWKWEIFLHQGRGGVVEKRLQAYRDYVECCLGLFPYSPRSHCSSISMLQLGIYTPVVNECYEIFGRDAVLVVNVEDYIKDRARSLDEMAEFLGLSRFSWPVDRRPINENPLKFEAPDRQTAERLARFYQPFNQELYRTMGRTFSWT